MQRHFLLCLVILLAATTLFAQEEPASPWEEQVYAPYVYMARYPVYQLAAIAETSGVRYFSLAFILGGTSCEAKWMGTVPLTSSYIANFLETDLPALRALGGEIIVSFGGAGGNELAQVCPDVASLTAQYQTVIDAYDVTYLDFDIEGDDIHEPEVIARRSQAIVQLQADAAAAGRELLVAFTLPVQPTGLTDDGISVLQAALDQGVRIDRVNIMTMNFGEDFPVEAMGANTIQAAQSLFGQLQTLYPEAEDADLWHMIGLTPMVGINDRQRQIFQPADAEMVTAFAQEQGIGLLAIWSLDRDQPCELGVTFSNKCSGIDQEPLAYSQIFNQLTTQPE